MLVGIVGEGAAVEFLGYTESTLREEQVLVILADPAEAALPADLGGLYALVSYVAARGRDKDVLAAGGVLLGRLPVEFGVLLARDLLKVSPAFAGNRHYLHFVRTHKDLLR